LINNTWKSFPKPNNQHLIYSKFPAVFDFPQHIICGFQIHPGLRLDHASAREWCSLFAAEVVFTSDARQEGLARLARNRWPDCQRRSQRQALAA
jgi:hypothetical protein